MHYWLKQLPTFHKILLVLVIVTTAVIIAIPIQTDTSLGKPLQVSPETQANNTIRDQYNPSPEEIVVDNLPIDPLPSPLPTADTNPLQSTPAQQAKKTITVLDWQTIKVERGDNLARIFNRAGYSPKTLYAITSADESTQILTKIHPGDHLAFGSTRNLDGSKRLDQLKYHYSPTETLVVKLDENLKYITDTLIKPLEIRRQVTSANIRSNFWNAGIDAGLNDKQIMNLANIFGWDIDFVMDIREGDQFSVVYETQYSNNEFIGTGDILAAEFINQDQVYQAIRYKDGEYYTPEGRSMRKAFLRAPVNFKYVSSNFNPRRFHPVLKRWKAHRGVDYAAKTGTPVVAAGSGKVIKSSYNKFNGHYVFIQHPGGIITKYLHFSKRKVKTGEKVKQGQLIGLVGSTGLSEAPHLHYEFIVNGVHRNPRTVKLPKALPIKETEKQSFLVQAKTMLSILSDPKPNMIAAGDDPFTSQNIGYAE